MPKKVPKKQYIDKPSLLLVGARIRELRLSKNMTLEGLAGECEVDYSQINRMELGKVNFGVSYLFKIAYALQVHPMELLRNIKIY